MRDPAPNDPQPRLVARVRKIQRPLSRSESKSNGASPLTCMLMGSFVGPKSISRLGPMTAVTSA
jgi:hypothetical protein